MRSRFHHPVWGYLCPVVLTVLLFALFVVVTSPNPSLFWSIGLILGIGVFLTIYNAHQDARVDEVESSILVILHVLPRTDSMDWSTLCRHPVMPKDASFAMIRQALEQLEEKGLVCKLRHREEDPVHQRYMLSQNGHTAARRYAELLDRHRATS